MKNFISILVEVKFVTPKAYDQSYIIEAVIKPCRALQYILAIGL